MGTVREEPLVMAPDVQGRGLLMAAKDVGLPGRCTCLRAQVPLHPHTATQRNTKRMSILLLS